MAITSITVDSITFNPLQPRKQIDEEYITNLAASIKKVGLLSPITVEKRNGKYQLITGEMRLRAFKQLGKNTIDAIVFDGISSYTSLLFAITENIHRKDLTSTEREDAIFNLWKMGLVTGELKIKGSKKELAIQLGLAPSTISNIIKAKEIRDNEKISHKVSTSTLTATASLPREDRSKIIKRVEAGEIPTRKVSDYVKVVKTASEPVKKALLTPRSQLKPSEAKIIDTEIDDKAKKIKAIKKVSGTKTFEVKTVQEMVTEIKEEDKTPKTEIKSYSDYYTNLQGEKHYLLRKIEDASIISRFERTPVPTDSSDVVCPHFLELKWARGCPFNCAWCYLQGTFRFLEEGKKPVIRPYEKIKQHMEFFLSQQVTKPEILNSGELADSLMWEKKKEPFSTFILNLFKAHNPYGHKILFLTKNDFVQNILDAQAQDVAIVSFTLNAYPVSKRWEKGAPSSQNRIQAATKLSNAGYETRLRIDPIVPIADWKQHYLQLIDDIFANFTPERITFGSLRGLQSTINFSTDTSWVKYLSETSNWGKKVDFQTRFQIYRELISHLKDQHNYKAVAMCKETLAMWIKLGNDWTKIKCNCIL